jgi:hypothetical protein
MYIYQGEVVMRFWFFWGLFVAVLCEGAQDAFHVFTDRQGRTVSARIIKVDELRGVVELELENKRRSRVKPSVFCEKDQNHIHEWNVCQTFMSSSGLRFSGERKVIEDWNESPGSGIKREYEKNIYRCELKNGSSIPYKDILVEYCMYWVQEKMADGEEVCLKRTHSARHKIPQIEPRSEVRFQTDPVVLFDQSLLPNYYWVKGGPDQQDSKMKGIWLKVSMTTPGGMTVVREFCEPSDVMNRQTWQEPEEDSFDKKES